MDINKIKFTRYEVNILLLVCLAQFITSADNVATVLLIKDIMFFFKVDITLGQVVTSSYAITSASLMLVSGLLGYFFSWKRIFQVGLLFCIVGEFFALVLTDFSLFLMLSRVIFGIGGALILPSCLALLSTQIQPKNRTMAFSIWGTSIALVVAIFPVILTLLNTILGWRTGFGFLGCLAFLVICLSSTIAQSKPVKCIKQFDIIGTLIIVSIIAFLLIAVSFTPYLGFLAPKRTIEFFGFNSASLGISVPMLLTVTSLLLAIFYRYWFRHTEKENKYYSILPKVFINKEALAGLYILSFLYIIYGGVLFIIVSYISLSHYSTMQLSIVIAAFAGAMFISSVMVASKARHVSIKNLNTFALLLLSVSTFYLAYSIGYSNAIMTMLIINTSIIGVACGILSSKSNIAVNIAVGPKYIEQSSGAQVCAKNIGYVFGVAILGGLLSHIANTQLTSLLLQSNSFAIIDDLSGKLNFISNSQLSVLISQFKLSVPNNILVLNDAIRIKTLQETLYVASFLSLLSIAIGRSVKNEECNTEN
ncbi:MAG: MFS transporter [Saccharospirillaceae bacterium]|nr:MFS transporter [Saccharospirillaceae bacterium]